MATIIKRSTRSGWVVAFIIGVAGLTAALWLSRDFSLNGNSNLLSIDQTELESASPSVLDDAARLTRTTRVDNSDSGKGASSKVNSVDSELEEALRWAREEAAKDVQVTYSLMFDHLELSDSQRGMLGDFFVEVAMSSTYMPGYRPEPIKEADRQAGIAAIIGDTKLEQLLTLEKNGTEYAEAGRIENLLLEHDEPMTEAQLDQMLDILVHVRGREQAVANPNAQPGTIEAIESQMATMDEYERLVLELAPSVLSTEQMQFLYERYQALSYRRAEILEMQKRSRANDSDEDDFPLGYPPRI